MRTLFLACGAAMLLSFVSGCGSKPAEPQLTPEQKKALADTQALQKQAEKELKDMEKKK